jgi:hypothetical protein
MRARADAGELLREQLRDPERVLIGLGLYNDARRDHDGFKLPCLWHIERTPSLRLAPGRAGTLRAHCFGCGHDTDVLGLVARARDLDIRTEYRQVLEQAADLAGVNLADAPAPPPRQPLPPRAHIPRPELEALWAAARPPHEERDPSVRTFLQKRRYDARELARLDLARVLPGPADYSWPAWWPRTWASTWRLAVPTFDGATGELVSLQARAVRLVAEDDPKCRWPWKTEQDLDVARGLFANSDGRALLEGRAPRDLDGVLFTEGLTDTVAAALTVAQRALPYAVLGGASGTFQREIRRVRWPLSVDAVVCVDLDAAGQRYARDIRAALPPSVRLLRWSGAS